MSYLGQQLGQGQAERFVYTATGGETSVTSDDAGRAIAYTVGQVDVYLNGAKLINGSDFTATTGTSITGLAALTASDVVEVFALSIFQASDTVSASTGGTFNGNVTIAADLSVTGTTTITTADINGGAIDGTTIGGSSAGAGTFSALTVNGSLGNLAVQSSGAELHFSRNENNDFLANGGTSASLTVGANNNLILKTGATLTERMRIDSSGNVGIGSSSPSGKLEVRTGGGVAYFTRTAGDTGVINPAIALATSSTNTRIGASGELQFLVGAVGTAAISQSEAMRIDSSQNVLVGKTTTAGAFNTVGTELRSTGLVQSTVDGSKCIDLNRLTSDGDIIGFSKAGTSVGSIGTDGTTTYVAGASKALKLGATQFIPRTNTDGNADNTVDLGASLHRFKDLYLSGGVYLGGTGSANKLDDYEEGTWTPTCVCSGQTITTTQAIGKYTKIGRIVHAECAIIINTVSGTASGATTITGLPFTNDGDNYSGMGALNYNDGFVNTLYASWIQSTTAFMRSGTRSQSNDGGGFSAGGYINIRWSYITNA
jgi:hypothetical protein